MDNTSWTQICLRSQSLELSSSSCNSVSIRGSKSACFFVFCQRNTQKSDPDCSPRDTQLSTGKCLLTHREGKGLLGAMA